MEVLHKAWPPKKKGVKKGAACKKRHAFQMMIGLVTVN
jgi:hypothetical protein